MFIPNSCIISVERVRQCDELKSIIKSNPDIFKTHPDADQLTLTLFLMYESLKGENSFWYLYIKVMGEADLACFWSEE
mgnify:CR=1 FL=1